MLPPGLAGKEALLTKALKTEKIDFCKKYQHWTSEQWKVMFSDESTIMLLGRGRMRGSRRSWVCSQVRRWWTLSKPENREVSRQHDGVGAGSGSKGTARRT